jgi:aminopeptidase N
MTHFTRSFCFLFSVLLGFSVAKIQAQPLTCQQRHNMAVLSPSLYYCAENKRSDTFDVLKYTISLTIGNSVTKNIQGNTAIRFAPKINNRTFIRFDLLKLTIDSVKESNASLLYSYNDTVLKVNFASPKNTVDTSIITVYYKGQPQADVQWGGFYFDNTGGSEYAYNLGVAFVAKPHNFGRVWFPCFDNFVERSKFVFNITSDSARRAFCNGQLMSDVVNGANRTRQWQMDYEIPSYLASVSVAKYTHVNWTANTLTGPKPVILAASPADTNAMKAGFVNLLNAITGFETRYGQYRWPRFGYCLVPFNGGAMEHATNISYPKLAAGQLTYSANIMAHELSHHWWGDNTTCETEEDMWLNEGMATYSQYIFTEWILGHAKYLADYSNQHISLLHTLHHQEGGFRAISGIPHNLTYGNHVYLKGADVAHSLRGYMGDTAFFNAVQYTMQQNQKHSMNSLEMRDYFAASSGQNLTDFFNNWVLTGGWPHFAIDSVKYVQVGANSYNAIVSLKQKIYGAPSLYNNVPLELSFFQSNWSRVTRKVVLSGASGTFTVNIPYSAVYCALNYDQKIGDATSFDIKTIKSASNVNWNLGMLYTTIQSAGADSSLVRVVHNWVRPDAFKNNPQNHRLSDQHYWRVEGILSPGFYSKVRFNYDGTKAIGSTFNYLDTNLTIVNGDSVGVFYRANAKDDWKLQKSSFVFQYDLKSGFIELDTLKLGEYTFGNIGDTSALSVKENAMEKISAKIYPNPARTSFKIELPKAPSNNCTMIIGDTQGRMIMQKTITEKTSSVDVSELAKGNYLVMIEEKGSLVYCDKLLIE